MAGSSITVRDYHKEVPGQLTPTSWLFPALESVNTHKKKTMWQIQVRVFVSNDKVVLPVPEAAFVPFDPVYLDNKKIDPNLRGWINVDFRIGDGKIRKNVPTIVYKGKNIGKASETNAVCQAIRDAYGEYNKHLRKIVGEPADGETVRYPPMLAQLLKEQTVQPDVTGCFVQRKYNGVRAVTTLDGDNVIMYSRRKKIYPGFGYIKAELKMILDFYREEGRQLYLDGEIYKHGVALQDISGQSRREETADDPRCDYMIYDCFVANEPELKYSQRKAILDQIFENFELVYAKPVETFNVNTIEEVMDLYKGFIEEGYEGAMLRLDSPYRYSYNEYHSRVLLKIKETLDAEFNIVGWETGEKGKAADALMIICEVNGVKFPVTPAMELPERIALAKKMSELDHNGKTFFETNYLNKPLIVYFDEYSKDGVPQRARTKMEIRNWD